MQKFDCRRITVVEGRSEINEAQIDFPIAKVALSHNARIRYLSGKKRTTAFTFRLLT